MDAEMRQQVAQIKEQLASISLRAHIRGVDAGSVAMSMGHSLEAYLRAYAWASKSSTADAFAKANEKASKVEGPKKISTKRRKQGSISVHLETCGALGIAFHIVLIACRTFAK